MRFAAGVDRDKTESQRQRRLQGLAIISRRKTAHGGRCTGRPCPGLFALKSERLSAEFQPEKLQTSVSVTKTNINSPDHIFSKALRENPDKVRKADEFVARRVEELDPLATDVPGPNRPVVLPRQLRNDPTILAAASVIARGGVGRLAFVDASIAQQNELKRRQEEAAQRKERRQPARTRQATSQRGSVQSRNVPPETTVAPALKAILNTPIAGWSARLIAKLA